MRDHYRRVQDIVTAIDEYAEEMYGAVVPPTFENTIYRYPDFESVEETVQGKISRYTYGKNTNPTIEALERKLARLEKGEAAKCFGSGTAAIYTTLLSVLQQGSHVITVANVYGRVSDFLRQPFAKFGVESTFVPGLQAADFEEALKPNTKLIYLESPTSWHFELQDIRRVTDLASKHGIKVVIDNTWATPVFQNPLDYGVDAVIHSASKYLSGHSDLVAGAVIGSGELITGLPQVGAVLSPNEASKLLKGMRTLALRMERHESSAGRIASFLAGEPKIRSVRYPGLPGFGQRELALAQMNGSSGLMSFELDSDKEGVRRFVNGLRHISIGGSWGGFESNLYAAAMSGSEEEVRSRGFGIGQIRLSVGLEDADTLLEDLQVALSKV
ncbi:trans-sulfuration enzyme family protein [Paenibacillus sp. MBLB4367]|uniref:trans-sulfuration enzyme family protein n=1 Tax=Paenibacillus sp. MBLB4367 TaxID=3384767 RepID=UPI0039083532